MTNWNFFELLRLGHAFRGPRIPSDEAAFSPVEAALNLVRL
jgi:hypothetical protein